MRREHHRRSIRLTRVDYSIPGWYFVTICTYGRECLFGDVIDGEMQLNEYGEIVNNCWNKLSMHFPNVVTDEYQIMPNHFHGIIIITDNNSIDCRGAVSAPQIHVDNVVGGKTPPLQKVIEHPTLGQIIGYFKYQSTKIINNTLNGAPGIKIWQRNYYEHIIRNDTARDEIRKYIQNNPFNWSIDENNPFNIK